MFKSFQHLKGVSLTDENFIPHFQPILNTISREIYGYEVLGRYYTSDKNEIKSLGAIFHDENVSLTERIQIDRIIRDKAIKHLKNSSSENRLFINMMPSLLDNLHKEELLEPIRFHIVQLVEKYNVNQNKIIIEITEEEFKGSLERLLTMITIFKEYGFKIAIDDVGAGFSNLERIGYIHPDIIKVDIKIMRRSLNSNSFLQVLSSLAELSAKLGSELLFEGIENEEELNLAFKMGATLLQGFYFSKANSSFQYKSTYSEELKSSLEKFSGMRFIELIEQQKLLDSYINSYEKLFKEINWKIISKSGLNQLINEITEKLPISTYEIFVTDFYGYKQSPIYFKKDKKWFIKDELKDFNFAWKPFFVKHKAETYFHKKNWSFSEVLYDIENQCKYIQFSYSINNQFVIISKINFEP